MTSNLPEINIAGRQIGAAYQPVFWPDIDIYFQRNESQAFRLIDAIAAAGCVVFKGAVLHRADICLPGHDIDFFDHRLGKTISREYRNVMEELVTPLDLLSRILARARSNGLAIVLSVYDVDGIGFAVSEQAAALKIPSSNINHQWLIETAAETGIPLVIDTGRSKWSEIVRAVDWASGAGAKGRLLIQHAPPGPPQAARRFHMRMLGALTKTFSAPVGLSDHCQDLAMLPMAVALGASVYEKGLVADSAVTGIDRAHALNVARLPNAMAMMREAWEAMGEMRRPDVEATQGAVDRMGCVAGRDLTAGEMLQRADIGFSFPAIGFAAEEAEFLVGKHLVKNVAAGSPLLASDFIPSGMDK